MGITWGLLAAAMFGVLAGAPLEFYAFLTTLAGVTAAAARGGRNDGADAN